MVTLFGSLFLEGKKRLFLFICRFIAVKTVFIALMRDFVAMKTVVITDYHGPHGNDDRLHGEKLRTSRKKGGKILWRKQEVFRFVREYSILRKFGFSRMSQIPENRLTNDRLFPLYRQIICRHITKDTILMDKSQSGTDLFFI